MRSVRLLNCALPCLMVSLMMAGTPSWAGIYKWVDEDGQVHYGERPLNRGAERMQIRTPQPAAAPATEDASEQAETDSDAEPEAIPPGQPRRLMRNPSGPPEQITETIKGKPGKPPEVVKQELSGSEKRRRCRDARDRLQSIQSRARLRETDASGNMRVLAPKERTQRIRQANKHIREYCR